MREVGAGRRHQRDVGRNDLGARHAGAREAGLADSDEAVRRYLDAVIGPALDVRREAYLTTGPAVVDYLENHSEVRFTPYLKHPDYLANRPGATIAGRPLMPVPFDGRLLGKDFELLRAPIGEFMALGGMMIGRDDIEPLARPFASTASFRHARQSVVALSATGCAIAAAPGC